MSVTSAQIPKSDKNIASVANFAKEIANGMIILEDNSPLAKLPPLQEESWRRTSPDNFFLPGGEVLNFAGRPVTEGLTQNALPWKVHFEKLEKYAPGMEDVNEAVQHFLSALNPEFAACLPEAVVQSILQTVGQQNYVSIAFVSICQSNVKVRELGISNFELSALPNSATPVTSESPIQLALAQRLSVCVPYRLQLHLSATKSNTPTSNTPTSNTPTSNTPTSNATTSDETPTSLLVILDNLLPAFNQSYSHTEVIVNSGRHDILTVTGGAGQAHLRHDIKIAMGAQVNEAWLAIGTQAQEGNAQLLERRIEVAEGGKFCDATVLCPTGNMRVVSNLVMMGEGASANCSSTLLASQGSVDYEPVHEHIGPLAESHLKSKTLAWGRARAIFQGLVRVPLSGVGATASQINKNLVLSKKARIDALPRLEIIPNEVSCKHGSAAGEIDQKQIHYLCTRGFSREQAEELVIKSFAQEGLSGLKFDSWLYEIAENAVGKIVSLAVKS